MTFALILSVKRDANVKFTPLERVANDVPKVFHVSVVESRCYGYHDIFPRLTRKALQCPPSAETASAAGPAGHIFFPTTCIAVTIFADRYKYPKSKSNGCKMDWPFSDPQNVAVIVDKRILYSGQWIAYVSHDTDDGAWQFYIAASEPPTEADMAVVGLKEITDMDKSIYELAALPLGWRLDGKARRAHGSDRR